MYNWVYLCKNREISADRLDNRFGIGRSFLNVVDFRTFHINSNICLFLCKLFNGSLIHILIKYLNFFKTLIFYYCIFTTYYRSFVAQILIIIKYPLSPFRLTILTKRCYQSCRPARQYSEYDSPWRNQCPGGDTVTSSLASWYTIVACSRTSPGDSTRLRRRCHCSRRAWPARRLPGHRCRTCRYRKRGRPLCWGFSVVWCCVGWRRRVLCWP